VHNVEYTGLISSTLLTRVVTPVLYKLFAPAVGHEAAETAGIGVANGALLSPSNG
jgi:hypothetical protein